MKKIMFVTVLIGSLFGVSVSIYAFDILSPEEINRIARAYDGKPGTFLLVACCPIYTLYGLELLLRVAEKAPSYDRVRTAIASYDCCKKIKTARENFMEAHDKGLLAAFRTQGSDTTVKQIKMKDE